MSRLIVVSNRISRPAGRGQAQTGGLAMALTAGLRAYNGLWFGWSGATTPDFTGQITTTKSDGITIATVDLEEIDVQEYYNGYANKTLWPVFHYRIDLAAYDRSFNQGYDRVNRRFAETLRPLIEPDDIVWIHDYHLIPMARELRRLGVKNRIGFFLHIPWPARQLVTTLPRHRQLVEALFDYDLIGFQTTEWLEAFEDYLVHEVDGRSLGDGRLQAFGKTIRAGAFPIGIDAEEFAVQVRSAAAARMYDRMAAQSVFRSMIVGVDRLDYSKGLDQRFLGFELFLQNNPDFHGKVFLLQIAPLSRDEVDTYQDIRTELDTLSGRINAAFADTDWSPIRYVNRNYRRDELAGVYLAARVGLVTPLRDGMNLVAKEYVAAQNPEDPGVLILSRFAGAAMQMKEALIVNPFSHEELAEALKRALNMDLRERKRRYETLFEGVTRDDVTAWRESFVSALEATRG
ncbi:MAG TPA: trehalose-6-phosphate synthase [Caulobacteraceae bacterium]|nr:trehalose-6-phosphate synthase [Caulobacteraceae bacterium]